MGKVIELDAYRKRVETSGFKFFSVGSEDGLSQVFEQVMSQPGKVWIEYYGPGGQIPVSEIKMEQNPESAV